MKSEIQCPFCNENIKTRVIQENKTFVWVFDYYPVSHGHSLLIPKRHTPSFFDLTKKEVRDFYDLLLIARKTILEDFKPAGFNIGVNIGEVAGQTIPHVHIHLIPRYFGDVEHPEGGVRKIIPNLINYP